MTPEKKLDAQITARIKALRKAGLQIFSFKLHGGPMQRAGIPDRVVIYNGHTIWLELKAPGGKLSKLQEATIGQMQQAGAHVYVIDNIKQFDVII